LAGQNEFEQIKVDEVAEWFKDIGRDFAPFIVLAHGTQEFREMLELQNTTKVYKKRIFIFYFILIFYLNLKGKLINFLQFIRKNFLRKNSCPWFKIDSCPSLWQN
jgi:hypothetical protein